MSKTVEGIAVFFYSYKKKLIKDFKFNLKHVGFEIESTELMTITDVLLLK